MPLLPGGMQGLLGEPDDLTPATSMAVLPLLLLPIYTSRCQVPRRVRFPHKVSALNLETSKRTGCPPVSSAQHSLLTADALCLLSASMTN